MESAKFYVTTPIYYVNDQPHIGHAYTTILADVLSRYHRLFGVPSYFLTGTDEHGQKVQRAAEKAGMSPQEQADTTVLRFKELWRRLNIMNDDFIRTTEARHEAAVQKILQDLYDRDEIYRSDYDGWYCVTCERFFTEKDLSERKCPEPGCGRPVERIRESNYFFRMSKYQDWLIKYIEEHPKFILPDFRRNETLGFLRKELNDLCISRPKKRLSWGIELPFDGDFVTYVWFDALVNYISAVGYLSDRDMFNKWWPASCHLIGKDILTTHTVYWPTMLKAMNVDLPETVFAHGWWLTGRDKMSKSSGNVVNPMEMADKYGVDAFRYFLMAEMCLGQDASFTEEAFIRRYNGDLANDLGNMLSRVTKLISVHCDGIIPEPQKGGPEEQALSSAAVAASKGMRTAVETMRLDLGLGELADVVRKSNRYLEKRQPWAMVKQGQRKEFATVLYFAAETMRIVGGIMYPVMPGKMKEMYGTLGIGQDEPRYEDLNTWGVLAPGTRIGKMKSLFPRIGADKVSQSENEKSREAASDSGSGEVVMQIDYSDFEKMQLKTAKIIKAERVEGADKLLKMDIEVGDEKRQIVAGIALHYKPDELAGRTIVIVANLKPAKIRGVESNGMLLAAASAGELRLLSVDGDIPSGAVVK